MSPAQKKGKNSGEPKTEKSDSKALEKLEKVASEVFEKAAKGKGGQDIILLRKRLLEAIAVVSEGDDEMYKKFCKAAVDWGRGGDGELNLTPRESEAFHKSYQALTAIFEHVYEIEGQEVHVSEKDVLKGISELSFSTAKGLIEQFELIAEKSPYESVREMARKKMELIGPTNNHNGVEEST